MSKWLFTWINKSSYLRNTVSSFAHLTACVTCRLKVFFLLMWGKLWCLYVPCCTCVTDKSHGPLIKMKTIQRPLQTSPHTLSYTLQTWNPQWWGTSSSYSDNSVWTKGGQMVDSYRHISRTTWLASLKSYSISFNKMINGLYSKRFPPFLHLWGILTASALSSGRTSAKRISQNIQNSSKLQQTSRNWDSIKKIWSRFRDNPQRHRQSFNPTTSDM